MRVVHLIDSLAAHGAETSLLTLAPALRTHGVDLEVAFLRSPPTLRAAFEEIGVTSHDLRGSHRRRDQIERIAAMLEERAPDLLHTTLYRADVAGRPAAARVGVPSVTTWASTPPEHGSPVLRAKRRRTTLLDRHTASLAVRFHAVSAPVADAVGAALGVDRNRIEVIPRARNPEALGPRTAARSHDVRARLALGDGPVVVALARHEPTKGLDVLVAAAERLAAARPDVRVLLAGDHGTETSRLERAIERCPEGSVRILGPVRAVGDLLAVADVCAVPSRTEGFAGTVVEAAMAGTPIVASDIPTIRAVVPDDDQARFIPVDSVDALVAQILGSFADPIDAADRARRAQVHATSNFSIDVVTSHTVDFYRRALHDAPARVAA